MLNDKAGLTERHMLAVQNIIRLDRALNTEAPENQKKFCNTDSVDRPL